MSYQRSYGGSEPFFDSFPLYFVQTEANVPPLNPHFLINEFITQTSFRLPVLAITKSVHFCDKQQFLHLNRYVKCGDVTLEKCHNWLSLGFYFIHV